MGNLYIETSLLSSGYTMGDAYVVCFSARFLIMNSNAVRFVKGALKIMFKSMHGGKTKQQREII